MVTSKARAFVAFVEQVLARSNIASIADPENNLAD